MGVLIEVKFGDHPNRDTNFITDQKFCEMSFFFFLVSMSKKCISSMFFRISWEQFCECFRNIHDYWLPHYWRPLDSEKWNLSFFKVSRGLKPFFPRKQKKKRFFNMFRGSKGNAGIKIVKRRFTYFKAPYIF